jgi:hypothetical protein
MDWKALLGVTIISLARISATLVRVFLLHRTTKSVLRAIPADTTEIDVRLGERRGPRAQIRARARRDPDPES